MEDTFKEFIDQIPKEIQSRTEMHDTPNIIVFRPQSYVVGTKTYLPDYHFTLPVSSPPPMTVEQHEHKFPKGRMLAFEPDTRIACTREVPTPSYIAVGIKKGFMSEIAKAVIGKERVSFSRIDNPYNSTLTNLIRSFEDEIENFGDRYPLMLQSIGVQIVIQILRSTENNMEEKSPAVDRNYIETAKEYICDYYGSNIKIEDICRLINLSPYHFIRMFKERTGVTPHEYLQNVRIGKAEEMLGRGRYTIEEIARLCGYVSASHFSKYFRRHKGASPSEYRARSLQR